MEGSRFAFMPPEEPGELFDLGGGKAAGTGDEDDFRDDLFESISEAHYLPALDGADAHFLPTLDVHGESLLQSLVEKGCEDNQILGRLDRLSAQLSTEAAAFEQGLLGEAPVGDLIERLESLESPSRSAAQGLLHLARRPSDVDPFVPDEVFAQEPVPAAAPASAPAPLPPAPPTADLMYADRIPDLPDTFDYEDYEDISPAEVPASVGSAAPTSHIANKAPDEPRPKPESDDNDLGDIKLDILAPDIVDMEDLKMDASELAIPKKEEPREEVEKPTDLSAILEVEPEKRSTPAPEPRRSSPVDILTYSENEAANKIDENLPKDLSIHRRLSSSYASPRRIDIPRAPSRDSDSMQSPQPSGIPAISPSPTNKCRMFLENLYGSTSPKMYTSEVTIQQCVPLNLGKHRKSASPTVSSCSEDVRNVNKDPGEPQEKRVRRESHDLNKICNMLKKCEENRLAEAQQKKKLSEIELLPPLEQLELLKSNKNFNLPDHMLVPRDRLNNIIAAPGKEIPALLMERFQLNMPEILQNPNCMGDLDLMVMSFEQMRQLIIHNDGGQPKPQAENDSKAPEDDTSKESGKVTPVSSGRPASRHSENKSTGSERTATPTGSTPRPHPAVGHLADDIDAANSAAAYQMSWLPAYLNHMSQLEAFAACSQNAEFLKALGSAGYAAGYPAPPHHAYHSRYAALPPAAAAAPPPPLDYESRMQLLMWQEAVHAHARHKRHDAAKDSHVAELAAAYAHHKASYGKHAQRYSRAALPAPALPSYVPRAPPSRSPPHEYMGARRAPELRPRISVKSLTELQQHTAAARRAAPAPPPRRRDEPEVGSTTSVPDLPHLMPPHLPMPPIPHDPTAFPLWHPLFSNQQKGQYTSPWSWTTVTATGD